MESIVLMKREKKKIDQCEDEDDDEDKVDEATNHFIVNMMMIKKFQ